jgi:Domain of unknown function (DUF4410)
MLSFSSRMLKPRHFMPFIAFGLLALNGCATKVQNTGTYVTPAGMGQATLARPAVIYIETFGVDAASVQLDSGVRAKLQRATQGDNGVEKQQQLATDVETAISDTLVQAINRMGLNAFRATQGAVRRPNDIVIQGQVVKISAGNQTRQNIIGLGAGASEVFANVQVLVVQPDYSLRVVQTYSASSNSGRTPGLAVGGVGAAGGHVALAVTGAVAGTVSRARSGVGRDAEDLAKRVATNLGTFFESQGWIAN